MTPEDQGKQQRRCVVSHRRLNDTFNTFLQIGKAEQALLARYREALGQGADSFIEDFYIYLLEFPATAEAIRDYRSHGGVLEQLAEKQSRHLRNLLSGQLDEENAKHLTHVGEIHYKYRIEPVWMMGAYQLYLNHLRQISVSSPDIDSADRHALEGAVTKLLFRDMGLMLEGYWRAATCQLDTERKRVADLQGQVSSLLANLPQVLWSVDVRTGKLVYISPTTRDICDVDVGSPIPCLGWTLPEDRPKVELAWQAALAGESVEVESRIQVPGSDTRWFRRVFRPFKDESGDVVRIDGLMDDVTDAKEAVARLHHQATTDELTGLPNRALLYDRLGQALASAERQVGRQVVLMLMDLDHFKEINDTLGHPAGDEILRQVAARLSRILRRADTLARLGGDEFAILLPDAGGDGAAGARKVAESVLNAFREPFWVNHHELYLGAGIGIAVYPEHGLDVDVLMSRADAAMYGAKRGEVGYRFYDPQSDRHTQKRLQLSADLRHALDREEFVLHYQPQVDLQSGRVIGVEALLRWEHPVRGLIMPDHFIPFAEGSGLINPITDWVLNAASAQCSEWRRQGMDLRVAVNVSARSFQDRNLVGKLQGLAGTDKGKSTLGLFELEITENTLMSDIEHGARAVGHLEELGVAVAIDDFGTGYSSLSYLKRLPIHSIKIDKSFVLNMAQDDNDAVIVRSTIDLAHNLGCRVVAEGVENQDALDLLAILGCDIAQGYHLGRPMSAGAFEIWLRQAAGA